MTTFIRTPRYTAAINELVDAIAEMPFKELTGIFGEYWGNVACDDLAEAFEERHRRLAARIDKASTAEYDRRRAKRRSEGARKAATTRAKQRASMVGDARLQHNEEGV
jgi:hypothetical protein